MIAMRPDPHASLAAAKRMIADALLDDHAGDTVPMLGNIVLRPHQLAAVARLRRAIDEHGGALLADEAGLGKTYVALALARQARCPLVVAPAALRDTWTEAMCLSGNLMEIVSYEALSSGGGYPLDEPDFVIADEAHHVRNPSTRRWRRLAELTAGKRVLLLSATPVHNRREDLVALLSLFLGARARAASDALLARCIVRRERDDASITGEPLPTVLPTQVLPLSHDDDLLADLVALPPPVGGVEHEAATALIVHGLVRQWASSEGALRRALVRRLTRATAIATALREGVEPSAAELALWIVADDAIQLPFAALLAPPVAHVGTRVDDIERHADAIRRIILRLDAGASRDVERAARLRQLRGRHPGARIVAFTSYEGTVRALWSALRNDRAVAALSADGGVVAGGTLSRGEVLRRFAPRAHGARTAMTADDVTLLVTTDLASEGVNLQDASVVVHLDLPWTAARLEQRVGRAARLGSSQEAVHVYAMAPPASAEHVLAVERRLREKLAVAARAVGVSGAIVPSIGWPAPVAARDVESAPRLMEATLERLARWQGGVEFTDVTAPPLVAAVRVEARLDLGALALVEDEDGARLVALEGDAVSAHPAAIARATRAVDGGRACLAPAECVRPTCMLLDAWLRSQRGARVAAVEEIGAAMLRRRAASVASRELARAPRHERTRVAKDAERVIAAVVAARGAGSEEAMARALASGISTLANDAGPGDRVGDAPGPGRVLAMVLLVPAR